MKDCMNCAISWGKKYHVPGRFIFSCATWNPSLVVTNVDLVNTQNNAENRSMQNSNQPGQDLQDLRATLNTRKAAFCSYAVRGKKNFLILTFLYYF